jgi:hypothetical protein
MTTWFYGHDLLAHLELDLNERFVPLARLCATLGLEVAPHERRARAHTVLAEGLRKLEVDDDDNRVRRLLCLRVDLVPLWLTTLNAAEVAEPLRAQLALFQREAASATWQAFRPQGFGPEDGMIPTRHEQTPAEMAYAAALTLATLARQQMLIERQLDHRAHHDDDEQPLFDGRSQRKLDDPQAETLARAVRRVAQAAAERTRRNEYSGVYSGLFRQFGINSYRRMPPARLREALEWLERWRGDLMGEPEPPPDIE